MKIAIFALAMMLLAGFSFALSVKPNFFEVKDTGNPSLDTLDISITINCDTKDVIPVVRANGTKAPVEGAETTLFYTDYGYNPLPDRGKTDAQGMDTINVPGTLNFLTGLFILRVDKQGFQSREIEFAYEKCFQAPPPPPPPPPQNNSGGANQPGQNNTPPANQTAPPPSPAQNQTTPGNGTAHTGANGSAGQNGNGITQGGANGNANQSQGGQKPPVQPPASAGGCPGSAFLLLPLAIWSLINRR